MVTWIGCAGRFDPGGEIDDSIGGIIIFSELITERKQAEEALAGKRTSLPRNCSSGRKARWRCTK